jgi:hypothetical protein
VPIQPASSLEQYAIADSYAPATAGRETAGAHEAQPTHGPDPAEEPRASTEPAPPITLGVYARNARPAALRMAASSISLLA